MSIKYKIFLAIFCMFLTSTQVLADCIVTNNNFNKSSKIIFVNQYNGSDQLAKTYSLDNIRNPYEANNVAAFQSIEKAKSLANKRNGDLILIKAGRQWTNYEAWEGNKLSDFNKEVMKASGMSQRQCQGESLTWVPSAVTDNQPSKAPVTTDSTSNNDEVTLARTEEISRSRLPRTLSTNTTNKETSSSTSSSNRSRSSGGSTSGGGNTDISSNDNVQASNQNLLINSTTYNSSRSRSTSSAAANLTDNSETQDSSIDKSADGITNTINYTEQNIDLTSCEADAPWRAAIQTYPQDSNGWSIITPDTDTKIAYVSSTDGNDFTARSYTSSEIENVYNPKNIQPYKSLSLALAQLREGKGDFILLKKGDKFSIDKTIRLPSGKSILHHTVLGVYGDSNKRPVIDTKTFTAIKLIKSKKFITVFGIEFYPSGLDPNSSSFVGWNNVSGATGFSSVSGDEQVESLFLENNRFSFYRNNIYIGGAETNKNIILRRNEILNSYSTNGHSQGIALGNINVGLIEQNVLDHNGWYQQRPQNVPMNTASYGYATYYNHNAYITDSSNLVITENLSSRSSSIGMKFASNSNSELKLDTINSYNILLKDNVIIEGEVGFSLGGNKDFNNGYRWDNIIVVDNVFTNIGRTRPTNRALAYNIDINDWQSGFVCGNKVTDNAANLTNIYGINVAGHTRDLIVKNNSFINLGIEQDKSYLDSATNITGSNNFYLSKVSDVNYFDMYVTSQGKADYQSYIESTLDKLKNNLATYYDVNRVIKFINPRIAITKQTYQAKE